MEQHGLNCEIGECYLWWSSPSFRSEFFFFSVYLFSLSPPIPSVTQALLPALPHCDSCYLALSLSLPLTNLFPTSHKGKGLDKIRP